MNTISHVGNLRPILLELMSQGCARNVLVRAKGVKTFTTLSIPAFLRTALKQPQVSYSFDPVRLTATMLGESEETAQEAIESLSSQHKVVYALVAKRQPNSTITWTDAVTEQTFVFKADDMGNILFYIGETDVSMKERARQHGVWMRQMKRLGTSSKKNYLLYRFMADNNIDFICAPISADGTMSEDDVVGYAKTLGHTLMNSTSANKNRKLDVVANLQNIVKEAQ